MLTLTNKHARQGELYHGLSYPFLQSDKIETGSPHLRTHTMSLLSQVDMAEKELMNAIASAEDFFDSSEEKEETLQRIRQNPEAILSSSEKPFMKKIARAMMAQVKEYTPLTQALIDQRAFLQEQMNEKIMEERARTEELLIQQQEFFQGQLSAEITRIERMLDDQKRMMKAAVALLTDEIAMKGEHTVNLSNLLENILLSIPAFPVPKAQLSRQMKKCIPL